MERELANLSLDDKEDKILQTQMDLHSVSVEIDLCLVGCFLTASVIHFPAMRSTMANLWLPVKGAQISDLGKEMFLFKFFHKMDLERVLKGSPWTFNNHLLMLHWLEKEEDPLKVPLIFVCFWVQIHEVPPGFDVAEMGWDLSLRAQSRRSLAMSSVWLREDGEGAKRGNTFVDRDLGRRIDPMLRAGVLYQALCWCVISDFEPGSLRANVLYQACSKLVFMVDFYSYAW
ncbi:hypothetical protein Gotur_004234 [Gossypium turneri]